MVGKSPLKAKPLRNPGESVDEEIRLWTDDALLGPFWFAGGLLLIVSVRPRPVDECRARV
jgi:hypothetical protein